MSRSVDARPSQPSPEQLFRIDRFDGGANYSFISNFAAEALRQRGQEIGSEVDLFAPTKPAVRDNVLFDQAVPAISDLVGTFPEADTARLVTDATPAIPAESGLNPAKRESARQRRQASRRVAVLLATITALGGGGAALAQQNTPEPTTPPNTPEPTFVLPSGEPTPLPTDPITGALPSCPPEASPSPSPSPTPVILAFVNHEGQDVTVTLDQELPSAPPSVEPSITPDPETAAVDPNCEPEIKFEPSITGDLPTEPVKFDFMDEAVEAPLGMNELKIIINSFYAKYPEAIQFIDKYNTKLNAKDRNKLLRYCQKGHPDDPKPAIEQSRASNCASLIRWFHELGVNNTSQGMIDLSQAVYWYGLANLKLPDPKFAMDEFLKLAGIEIRNQTIQG